MEKRNERKEASDKQESYFGGEKAKYHFVEDKGKNNSSADKTKTILAVDLGTTTGWAIKNVQDGITSGSVSFKQSRFAGGGMRYLKFQRWLESIPKVELVVFEEVRNHIGVDAAHAYGGFLSNLTLWCEMHQIPYQGIPVGTIKKFITGKGNASKAEVISTVKSLGHDPGCDNEADALAMIHFAIENISSAKKM